MGVAAPASNEGENPSQFLSVVSVSTGIGDEMLRQLETKLAPHWIKEHPESIIGPKVYVLLNIILGKYISVKRMSCSRFIIL